MDNAINDGYATLFEKISEKVKNYTGIETLEYTFSSNKELCHILEQMISSEYDTEQKVIRSYYGIGDIRKESMRSIGASHGLSCGQVERIINKFTDNVCSFPFCQMLINIQLESCSLEQLGLSRRAINCLQRSGIQTTDALIRLVNENQDAMLGLKKCGEETRNEITYKINLLRGKGATPYKKHFIKLSEDNLCEYRTALEVLSWPESREALSSLSNSMQQAIDICITATQKIVHRQQ